MRSTSNYVWDTVENYPAGHVESIMTLNKEIHYREGLYAGYRQQSLQTYTPRFAFGHGLSYTAISCSIKSPALSAFGPRQEMVKVSVEIRNTGSMAASQTILLSIEALEPATPRPSVELRALAKTEVLEPGTSQDMDFCLKVLNFSYCDVKGHLWRVDAGNYMKAGRTP
ncbi:hypothetical protein FVEG_15712 [Fusarium verticillioides 7600]|uniref:beta-glucosidase n=1 Tax=Gibberella moniliformis (strain M3125 / FGSC 7600) TaxID=334819 RepID=W7MB68_GIBM7|nr:hypothetical protein FVEG_15712 [Fusarium verticillioides 7600]EWG44734.1 hypothetical protein FVEG_15712 [Fusarium verticillioides 7600]